MSLMNQIQQSPMQFLMPQFSPALSSNPEIAKAAQYNGTGGAPAAGGATAPNGQQAQPAQGMAQGAAQSMAGGGNIMDLIRKFLGNPATAGSLGSMGAGMGDVGAMIAGL